MGSPVGSLVTVRGERWRLAHVDAYDNCSILTLDGRDAANAAVRMRVIEPFDRVTQVRSDRFTRGKRSAVLQAAISAIAAARPPLSLWTAARAAIDLHAYQFEPALAILRGATRLLLADAVGLGKTIQAGLILAELRERGWAERALVLCPAGLRELWVHELARFHVAATVIDQTALAESAASLPPGINPWLGHATIVASIDFVKRPEVLAALEEIPFDILIADEAHHLTPGTDRGAAVARLASRTPWCVLASATPHSGDVAAFDYLTNLGRHRDPITIFRRTRDDVGLRASRRERLMRVQSSEAEATLLTAVEEYVRAIWRARGAHDRSVQLVAITVARRAASSPLALARTLARRLTLLGPEADVTQSSLQWDDDEDADGPGDARVLAAPGLEHGGDERAAIARILALIGRCDAGAKVRRVRRLLERVREPAIVFTEYRDTLDAILEAMRGRCRIGAISGDVPLDLRRATIEAFTRGEIDVLAATDAAGEGLNLHHRCRLVIDVELPWNPLRLEQRIGRVDRLGQQRRVHAIRLFHADTIEQRVLDQLQRRRQRAEALRGDAVSEIDVARAIFDGCATPARHDLAIESTTVPEARAEADRCSRQRRDQPEPQPVGAMWTPAPRTRPASLVTIHRFSCTGWAGASLAEHVCAHRVELTATIRSSRLRPTVARAVAEQLANLLEDAARACGSDVSRALVPIRAALTRRIASIRRLVALNRPREFQPSLFDRRSQHVAERQAVVASRLDAALARRQQSIAPPSGTEQVSTRLVAMWPVRSR